eukprot:TRINITY_DN77410_c0_g1_i1.p1 TRINITY_DN77410_c0_g1~~TRINITY_DN77410_c0_g1_i1.p1  ORF type:complete len:580 (+),score=99.04 TRINITY_DN77410_c0_g1_i1:58-1797(+)
MASASCSRVARVVPSAARTGLSSAAVVRWQRGRCGFVKVQAVHISAVHEQRPAAAFSRCSHLHVAPQRSILLTRRAYLDSVDRAVAVQSMTEPMEVLDFMDKHSDSDTRTHEVALRSLGRLAARSRYQEVVGDARFHALLSNLASRLDDCDARMLSMIADASARYRTSTPELSALTQRLAEVAIKRKDDFNPRNLATVAIALSIRGVRDESTIEFIRSEAIQLMDDLEPSHCVMLLEAFRRWGISKGQIVDKIIERMSDEVDRFTAHDLVDALAVISRLGLARAFLLRQLCELAFNSLNQFDPRQLARMANSLAKLRFISNEDIDRLADAIRPDLEQLAASQVSELLFALAMVDARHQSDLARVLIAQFMASPGGVSAMSSSSLIDFAWSLAALDLIAKFEAEFKAVLEEIFGNRSPPQNRVPLMKLFDVMCALQLAYTDLGVAVPAAWKAACDDADRFEMDRLDTSQLHNEIVKRFDNLRGAANGMKWQLRMQRNQSCGPYRVDMLDEETQTALDLEIINWPTSRHLKHRLLESQGYRMLRLQYWDWRSARTEADQNLFLEREVTRLFEAHPLAALDS